MEKELTWKEELELAESYANEGPNEWPEEHLNRCIKKATDQAKKDGVDISKEVKHIKNIWKKH